MATLAFKVYGKDGHRQRVSFDESKSYDWSSANLGTRILKKINSDITGTNEFSLIVIEKDTEEEVRRELDGQLSDGIFENYNYGKIEEVSLDEIKDWLDILEEKISERDDI